MQVKTVISIPKRLKPKERELLGEAVVDYIRERTLSGRDKNNRKFHRYTEKYAKEKGVSRDSVDLFRDGDMLAELTLVNHKSGEIVVGFDKDSEMNGRAEGNIKGTYGQPEPVTKPRDFLGITNKDLKALIDAMSDEPTTLTDEQIDRIARQAARDLLGIDFGTEDTPEA